MTCFDALQAKAMRVKQRQRVLHPLSDAWHQCELALLDIYNAQMGTA